MVKGLGLTPHDPKYPQPWEYGILVVQYVKVMHINGKTTMREMIGIHSFAALFTELFKAIRVPVYLSHSRM